MEILSIKEVIEIQHIFSTWGNWLNKVSDPTTAKYYLITKNHILKEVALTMRNIITRFNYSENQDSEMYVQNIGTYLHNLQCSIQYH